MCSGSLRKGNYIWAYTIPTVAVVIICECVCVCSSSTSNRAILNSPPRLALARSAFSSIHHHHHHTKKTLRRAHTQTVQPKASRLCVVRARFSKSNNNIVSSDYMHARKLYRYTYKQIYTAQFSHV